VSVSVQRALLELARDYAGGVSYLARKLEVGFHSLDAMLVGNEEIPEWVFVRAVEYVNQRQAEGTPPPGLPADWQDALSGDDRKR
jgi:hypothetical protein